MIPGGLIVVDSPWAKLAHTTSGCPLAAHAIQFKQGKKPNARAQSQGPMRGPKARAKAEEQMALERRGGVWWVRALPMGPPDPPRCQGPSEKVCAIVRGVLIVLLIVRFRLSFAVYLSQH